MNRVLALGRVVVALVLPLALAGCLEKETQAFAEPPPPEVVVAPPTQKSVQEYFYATGTIVAVRKVEVRARVEGFLEEKPYDPGTLIEEGALLFRIDDLTYRARVDAAKASLENRRAGQLEAKASLDKARADLDLAVATLKRFEQAFAKNAVAEIEVLENRSKVEVAKAAVEVAQALVTVADADVKVAEAELQQREIDLGYCEIRSPMTGRVLDSPVEVGDLVGRDATLLSVIVDDSQVYAYFDISEQDLARGRDTAPEQNNKPKVRALPIELGLIHDKDYPHHGVLDYVDPELDATSGTLRARAIFENAERRILPGMFIRVRAPVVERPDVLLVPEVALSLDQSGRYLLVVNSENKVERRDVEVGPKYDEELLIESGLAADDRVIVVGIQRARPGAVVNPTAQAQE